MGHGRLRLPSWTGVVPPLAVLVLAGTWSAKKPPALVLVVVGVLLAASVLAAVHHAEDSATATTLATLCLVLPTFTTSRPGPEFSPAQMVLLPSPWSWAGSPSSPAGPPSRKAASISRSSPPSCSWPSTPEAARSGGGPR